MLLHKHISTVRRHQTAIRLWGRFPDFLYDVCLTPVPVWLLPVFSHSLESGPSSWWRPETARWGDALGTCNAASYPGLIHKSSLMKTLWSVRSWSLRHSAAFMLLTHTFVTLVGRSVALNEAHSHPGPSEEIHLTVTEIINTLPG